MTTTTTNMQHQTRIPGRRLWIALAGILTIVQYVSVGAVLASDSASVDDRLIEEKSVEGYSIEDYTVEEYSAKGPVTEKAVACHAAGKYCYGQFEELVAWIRYSADGEVRILLQPDAINAVNASGFCTLRQGNQVLIPEDSPVADRFITLIMFSRALDESFRLNWVQGASGFCELNQIYSPYG